MAVAKVKFKVLEIMDKRNWGSSLEIGKIYTGILVKNYVYWTDPMNEQEWVFFVGQTCEIIKISL